jgi:hypothetical protein
MSQFILITADVPGSELGVLKFFLFFLNPSRPMPGNFLKLTHNGFLPLPFNNHPIIEHCRVSWSQDIRIGMVMGYRLEGQDSIPRRDKKFSLLHNVQTASRPHPASYPMGTGGCILGNKAPGA